MRFVLLYDHHSSVGWNPRETCFGHIYSLPWGPFPLQAGLEGVLGGSGEMLLYVLAVGHVWEVVSTT